MERKTELNNKTIAEVLKGIDEFKRILNSDSPDDLKNFDLSSVNHINNLLGHVLAW